MAQERGSLLLGEFMQEKKKVIPECWNTDLYSLTPYEIGGSRDIDSKRSTELGVVIFL